MNKHGVFLCHVTSGQPFHPRPGDLLERCCSDQLAPLESHRCSPVTADLFGRPPVMQQHPGLPTFACLRQLAACRSRVSCRGQLESRPFGGLRRPPSGRPTECRVLEPSLHRPSQDGDWLGRPRRNDHRESLRREPGRGGRGFQETKPSQPWGVCGT